MSHDFLPPPSPFRPSFPSRKPRWASLARAVALIATLAAPAAAQVIVGPLAVQPEPTGVGVLGVTPGESVALLGISYENLDGLRRLTRWQQVAIDGDSDGEVHFDLGQAAPATSTWVAVETSTGRAGTSAGDPTIAVAPVAELASTLPSTAASTLALDRFDSATLLVRPGVGAWSLFVGDGSDLDANAALDGVTVVAIGDALPIGSTTAAAPSTLAPNDVVAVIDPSNLAASVVQLTCDPQNSCSEEF